MTFTIKIKFIEGSPFFEERQGIVGVRSISHVVPDTTTGTGNLLITLDAGPSISYSLEYIERYEVMRES